MTGGDDYPRQQARLRERMLERQAAGDVLAVDGLEAVLERADRAAISGKIVEILTSYEEMVKSG